MLKTEGEWQRCRNVTREKFPSLFSAHSYDSFICFEQAALSLNAVAWFTYLTCAVVMSWVEICASWKWACIRSNIYAFANESSWNANSDMMVLDRPQYDCFAACVVAQQYSSTTFVSLCLHYRKEKFGPHFKNVIVSPFFTFLKLRNSGIA
jgi:hypothetical protein